MAKAYVTYGCGHTVKVNLPGTIQAREEKIEWMNNNLCPGCYRKQKKTDRAYESIRAAELAVALGFPPLLGMPAHIALANTIRQKHYERVCYVQSTDKLRSFLQLVTLEKYAKWWIDNRVLDIDSVHKVFAGTDAAQTDPRRRNRTGSRMIRTRRKIRSPRIIKRTKEECGESL